MKNAFILDALGGGGGGVERCVTKCAAEKDTLTKLRCPPMVNAIRLVGFPVAGVAINLTGGGWARSRYDN